jgi:beta-phosphoglucomutase-like phosphatase (HAD superfamily)
MIQAEIFDLDGTLIQTENLNAHAHAPAAIELNPKKMKKRVYTRLIPILWAVIGKKSPKVW